MPTATCLAAASRQTNPDVAAYYAAQPKHNPNPTTLGKSPPAIVRPIELGDPGRSYFAPKILNT
jgi:hypothetical protein